MVLELIWFRSCLYFVQSVAFYRLTMFYHANMVKG